MKCTMVVNLFFLILIITYIRAFEIDVFVVNTRGVQQTRVKLYTPTNNNNSVSYFKIPFPFKTIISNE